MSQPTTQTIMDDLELWNAFYLINNKDLSLEEVIRLRKLIDDRLEGR